MSSLQDKMKNYEVNPPADVWGRIAAALDENKPGQEFQERLYAMEVAPPAAAWDTIKLSLQEEAPEALVVPMKKRTAFFRYAAAAILIGVVAFGIIKWTSGTGNNTETASVITDSLKGAPSTAIDHSPNQPDTESSTAERTDESKNMLAEAKTMLRKSVRPVHAVNYAFSESYDEQYSNPIYAYEDHVPNIADRYIMLMTPDGNYIRMSKKLGNLICCVSGEEQDAECKSQLQKWQEKMATSSLSASSDNFLDILNLVGSLDENGIEL